MSINCCQKNYAQHSKAVFAQWLVLFITSNLPDRGSVWTLNIPAASRYPQCRQYPADKNPIPKIIPRRAPYQWTKKLRKFRELVLVVFIFHSRNGLIRHVGGWIQRPPSNGSDLSDPLKRPRAVQLVTAIAEAVWLEGYSKAVIIADDCGGFGIHVLDSWQVDRPLLRR